MKMKKRIISSSLAFITSLCCINLSCGNYSLVEAVHSYTYTYDCDVNNDGNTDLADCIAIIQYITGTYNIADPDIADFDNDGFISELDLSDYNIFGRGYALDRAIIEEAAISITGFSGDLTYEATGEGQLKNSTSGYNDLKYTCDTYNGASGSPVYTDLVYNGEHYYVVVGIHTSGKGNNYQYNSGVRMCPNIWHLVKANI